MKASNLSIIGDFFKANKPIWKKYRANLIFSVASMCVMWFLEGLFNLRILRLIPIVGGMPWHYLAEWYAFFYVGCFVAEIKKTLIPTEIIVSGTYLLTVSLGLYIIGFFLGFNLSFFFMTLFVSPFLFGYLITRIRKLRKR